MLGQRALAGVLPLLSPAIAAARYTRELLTWRLPALLVRGEEEVLV